MESLGICHVGKWRNTESGGKKSPLTLRIFFFIYVVISTILFIVLRYYLMNDNDLRKLPRPIKYRGFKPVQPSAAEPARFLSSNNAFFVNFTRNFRAHEKNNLLKEKKLREEKEKGKSNLKTISTVNFLGMSEETPNRRSKLDILSSPVLNQGFSVTSESEHEKLTRKKIQVNNADYLKNDFQWHWFRQRQARVDWRSFVWPCENYTRWDVEERRGWGKKNRTNANRSYVSFWDIRPAGEFSRIFVQSRTAEGHLKTFGGDFWRVYLRGPSSVSGTVIDHNNGTYEILFLIMEPGFYTVKFHLDYSLCDGLKDPPDDWFIKGNAQGKFHKEGALGDVVLDEYLQLPFNWSTETVIIPPRRLKSSRAALDLLPELESCRRSCRFLWDGFGRWVNDKWYPYLDDKDSNKLVVPRGYRPSGTLWIYGDSLGVRFFWSINNKQLCTALYSKCGNSYNWIYPVHNEQVEKKKMDNLDFNPEKVLNLLREVLEREYMNRPESTLLLNLGLHYAVSVNFTTYRKLIDSIITMMQEKEISTNGSLVPKYKTKIIWKTTTAIFKEQSKKFNETQWRFFTPQRVQFYNAYATSAMCDAGYEVIDVYPLSASWPQGTLQGDVVHYNSKVFESVEQLLGRLKLDPILPHDSRRKRTVMSQCIAT